MNHLFDYLKGKADYQIRNTIDLSFCYTQFTSEGIIKDCNKNFADLFGYSMQELIGQHHRVLADDSFANSPEYVRFWSDLGKGEVKSGEFHRKHKNGRDVFISAAYTPQKDKRGNVTSVIKIASDVTKEREVTNQMEALRQSIDLSYAYIQFDPFGHILNANDNFIEVMGYGSLEEIIGQHHSIFVRDSYKESKEYELFWEGLRSGGVQSGEFVRVSKDNQIVWLQSSYSPVRDSEGNITSVVKVAKDITKEKEVSDFARDVKQTIDLSFGFIQFDPNGKILEVNRNFYELLGYQSLSEVIGKHHSIFVTETYKASADYAKFWDELRQGKTQAGQFQRMTKSGEEVWIQAAYTPLVGLNGNVESVIKVAADITSDKREAISTRKGLQQELLQNVTEIASSIGQMASGARTQAEKIDQSSESIESSLIKSREVSNKAESIASAAATGKENSQQGGEYIAALVSNMKNLSDTARQTQTAMEELTKKTEEVNYILNVMQEIANNTNLLALNAAIEASKAGDSGRGFAVIAQEIRMLAENARDSVNEIEEKIILVNKDSQGVAAAMKEVLVEVDVSGEATQSVQKIFSQILQSNERTASLSKSIVTDSSSQMDQLKHLVITSEEIVVISEQTAAGTEEVLAAAQQLEDRISKF